MTNRQLKTQLKRLGACCDAVTWVGARDLATAWRECLRGDWLLWLCAKQIGEPGWPTHQAVVLAACACAEVALVYVPAGEDRPRLALEAARKWTRGGATVAEVRATYAATTSAYAATDAAYAAAYAATVYAYASPLSLAHSADLVRSMLTIPSVA